MIQTADQMKTPLLARHYPPPTQRLVRVCAVLQREWGDRPFFLSVRTAAEILGDVPVMTAWRVLRDLQFEQIIRLEDNGTLRNRRASTWRYLLEDNTC